MWFAIYPQSANFQKYGVNEGLSSNTVFSTLEDKDGYIWISTEEGVDRFDGINFKNYRLPNLFEYRNGNNVIHFIKIDNNNQIWVVTQSGLLYRYNSNIDEFDLFYLLKDYTDYIVQSFYIDHKNELWFGMLEGVIKLNPQTKKLQKILTGEYKTSAITQDSNNRYYLATDKGIKVLDSSEVLLYDLLDVTQSKNTGLKGSVINSFLIDEANNLLWMGSNKLGLCGFNLVNFDFIKPKGFPKLKGIYIKSIEKFSKNEIILGIDGEGILIWDVSTESLTQRITDDYDASGGYLNTKSIQHIFRNKTGVFFISTWRGGLNVYNPEMAKFQSIRHVQGSENSLANNVVLSLFNVEPGVIGFGTDKGISIWDIQKNDWQHLDIFARNEKHISNSRSISVDIDGQIWATSYTDSLVVFKKNKNGRYISTKDFSNEMVKQDFNKVYAGNDGLIWLSGDEKELIGKYKIKTDAIQYFPLVSAQVQTMLDFSPKRLIIGTSEGLKLFNKEQDLFESIDFIDSSLLSSVMISSLAIDSNKQLWVGTRYKGLFLVNFFKKTLTKLTTEDGLNSNRIFSLVASEDDVWISSANGISKIDNKLNVSHFSESDGLISIDFNYNVALLNSSNLYFGTNEGVIIFNPENVHSVDANKSLVFNEFYLNYERILAIKGTPLKQPLNETEKLNLEFDQNSFSIGFSSIDFSHADQGDFIWKLENFDKQWIKNQEVSMASYTNLNPGEYVFKLRMVNQKDDLIAPERQLKISIAPPFWFTYWAYFLYLLGVILLFALLGYLNTLRVTSNNSKEKLHYLVNIAHEIKTPLMLIKAPLTDLLNNAKADATMLQGIQIALRNTEKVNMQMVQFLDFRHFRLRKKTVIFSSIDLVRFLKDKVFAFKILADKKRIKVSFEYITSELIINSDEKILDKIVGNLLSNAIKYTKDCGEISVQLILTVDKCKIQISDSGIGIPKSQQKKIFQLFYRTPAAKESGSLGTGVGLVLARDLAKLIDGKVTLDSSSSLGSVFSFVFPYELAKTDTEKRENNLDILNTIEENATTPNIKVLLVEDDLDLLEFSKKKLDRKYHVYVAGDGITALEIVKKDQPDIIISDVMMPKMNGIQLCMNLKKNIETCHIPLILLTGLSSKENMIQGLESGADDYITKPYDYELLLSKVEGLLRNRYMLKKKFLVHDFKVSEIDFSNELDENFMNELTQYVEENMRDENFSVKDMCEAMGMSRTSFYHKIKGLIDVSPNEFIRTIRLKKGKSLLLTGSYNVSEVAYKVGFSDAKYFGTLFKKYYGKSPSVFLADNKGQE